MFTTFKIIANIIQLQEPLKKNGPTSVKLPKTVGQFRWIPTPLTFCIPIGSMQLVYLPTVHEWWIFVVNVGKYTPQKMNVPTKKWTISIGKYVIQPLIFMGQVFFFGGGGYHTRILWDMFVLRRGVFGLVAGETDLLHAHHAKDNAGLWPQQEGGGSCWKKRLVENAVFFFPGLSLFVFLGAFSWDPNEAVFFPQMFLLWNMILGCGSIQSESSC